MIKITCDICGQPVKQGRYLNKCFSTYKENKAAHAEQRAKMILGLPIQIGGEESEEEEDEQEFGKSCPKCVDICFRCYDLVQIASWNRIQVLRRQNNPKEQKEES